MVPFSTPLSNSRPGMGGKSGQFGMGPSASTPAESEGMFSRLSKAFPPLLLHGALGLWLELNQSAYTRDPPRTHESRIAPLTATGHQSGAAGGVWKSLAWTTYPYDRINIIGTTQDHFLTADACRRSRSYVCSRPHEHAIMEKLRITALICCVSDLACPGRVWPNGDVSGS